MAARGSYSAAARNSQEQAGAARSSQEEPGAARSCQEQPEVARSSQQQPGAASSSQEQQGAASLGGRSRVMPVNSIRLPGAIKTKENQQKIIVLGCKNQEHL